ncbi:MAG: YwmB family TATA-box binding protein [Cellulosilyticaceae bacterium]
MGIVIIIVILKAYVGPKLTIIKVEKSVQALPIEIQVMDLNLTGIKFNEYPTQNQMLVKAKRAIQPFIHTVECKKQCKNEHEENYDLKADFKRLDKRIEVIGAAYNYPYIFTLYNGKEDDYHLYYEMIMPLNEQKEMLHALQKSIDQVEKAWGMNVKQTISIRGTLEGQVEKELRKAYATQIFNDIGAYWNENYQLHDEGESIYYAYISHFKEFEMNAEGNKYNVILKFIFDPITQQTQLSLEFPSKM